MPGMTEDNIVLQLLPEGQEDRVMGVYIVERPNGMFGVETVTTDGDTELIREVNCYAAALIQVAFHIGRYDPSIRWVQEL